MTTKLRLLTKSRFKTGCECPTKLYFTGKPEYGNNNVDNSFLEALKEGGFQVGELAKLYYEGGTEIDTLDVELAIARTNELLKGNSVTIYEPAIRFKNLLVRVDILVKQGNLIELIEVKAKSFDPSEENTFYNKRDLKKGIRKLSSEWEPYLLDIAFQTYVAKNAFPMWRITSALMLADKSTTASVDGLNQRFFLESDPKGRTRAVVKPGTTQKSLGDPILKKVGVDEEVNLILENAIETTPFADHVKRLASAYESDTMIQPAIGGQCKSCEFRIAEDKITNGLKSGFQECWSKAAKLSATDFKRPLVFDIWNFRKSTRLIEEGRLFMELVEELDVAPRPRDEESGLSSTERQWLQIQKVSENDDTPFIDKEGLSVEMASWNYPLHFIDFETTMAAIPFNKGRRPYEQVAFQFSHHIVTKDGRIEHRSEYINRERGSFPNFAFVRALKQALSGDNGTIFRYAAHENTVLCQIREQLKTSKEKDRDDLISWIETITKSPADETDEWEGKRNMVDLCDLVKRYYYNPLTKGSNSIKKVLPAILCASTFLQQRYSKPIYGIDSEIVSKNYQGWQWIKFDKDGTIVDPYKLLPPIFSDIDLETMDSLITEGSLADGGAAMTAYARMQFTEMSEAECERVTKALLRYCELDTFAMVMIYEYWKHEIESQKQKAA